MSLRDTNINESYKSLLNLGNTNSVLSATPQSIKDGDGNESPLALTLDNVTVIGDQSSYNLPISAGVAGQVLASNGSDGTLYWTDPEMAGTILPGAGTNYSPTQHYTSWGSGSTTNATTTIEYESGTIPPEFTFSSAAGSIINASYDGYTRAIRLGHVQQTTSAGAPPNSEWAEIDLTVGTGTNNIILRIRNEGEAGYDFGRIFIDGAQVYAEAEEVANWETLTYTVSAGTHTIRFLKEQDHSVEEGINTMYIGPITYIPNSALSYKHGDTVNNGGTIYFCLIPGTAQEPPGSDWVALGSAL